MTISSSLNAGVAGLAANANRLASISDNIANSSTNGYKRVETDFHSMVISSGAGKYAAGGVRSTTQRMIDQSGALIPTSNPTDLAVRGRGFFPVTDLGSLGIDNTGLPMSLATTGSFRLDEDGFLRTATGIVLMGIPADQNGNIQPFPRDTAKELKPVQIPKNQFVGEPTTRVDFGVNLPATDTNPATGTGAARTLSVEYFDNLGLRQNLTIEMTPSQVAGALQPNRWDLNITDSAGPLNYNTVLTFSDGAGSGGTLDTIGGAAAAGNEVVSLTAGAGTAVQTIDFNLAGLTQLSDIFAPTAITKDGAAVGNMTGVEVDDGGFVIANFDTGISRRMFQVPILDVGNPNQLVAMDNQTYGLSAGSGGFFMWDAGDGPTGDLVSSALEGSSTDVAGELTNLIQTQRAYSSNAKVIQTVDEMLQETTNIKR